jgi:hypothetical protein
MFTDRDEVDRSRSGVTSEPPDGRLAEDLAERRGADVSR